MRILFLCNKSPWPSKEGGPIAMNMLIGGMLEAGNTVKVLAVNSFKYNITYDDIPTAYRQKTGIELIDVDLRVKAFRHSKTFSRTIPTMLNVSCRKNLLPG